MSIKIWNGTKLNLAYMRVFLSTYFAHVPSEKQHKLKSKSINCTIVDRGTRMQEGPGQGRRQGREEGRATGRQGSTAHGMSPHPGPYLWIYKSMIF